jgi:hypothetical protein
VTARTLSVLPFCDTVINGMSCRERQGQLEDAAGKYTGRCGCRNAKTPTPKRLADAGKLAAATAHRGAYEAACKTILDASYQHPVLSADTVREELDAAQVPGPVRGSAFTACANPANADRYCLDPIGDDKSDHGPTHGKKIALYRSRNYRGQS